MFDATPTYETKCSTSKPENVRKLIAWLREGRGPEFDMFAIFGGLCSLTMPSRAAKNDWCGTTACIAGHAAILAHVEGIHMPLIWENYDAVEAYLGIRDVQGYALFGEWVDPCSISEAIGKLEALLEPV